MLSQIVKIALLPASFSIGQFYQKMKKKASKVVPDLACFFFARIIFFVFSFFFPYRFFSFSFFVMYICYQYISYPQVYPQVIFFFTISARFFLQKKIGVCITLYKQSKIPPVI